MSNEHLKRVMNIVHSLDGLRHQLIVHLCRLTAQVAEAYPEAEGVVLESIIDTLVHSSSRMTTDLMVARYRLLRSFHEENPAIPLLQAEADSTNSTAPVARVNR